MEGGHHLIRKDLIEERFGLKVVLNSVDEKNIRSIDKRNLGALSKQSKEQTSRSAETMEFGIDLEQDLIQAVTGLSTVKELGKIISGKDSLHLSVPNNISNIEELLKQCLEIFESKVYKEKFPWVDRIADIRNPVEIEKLNKILLEKINSNNFDKIWLAIPEIIEWQDFDSFTYKRSQNAREYSDLSFEDFISEHIAQEGKLTIEKLKNYRIYCNFETSSYKDWSLYECIYAEVEEGKQLSTLNNSKWYKIDQDFSSSVEEEYKEIMERPQIINLPACPTKVTNTRDPVVENIYNRYASTQLDAILLDRDLIRHQGSPIEICDIFTSENYFIHVKHYGGSSVLSHLFNQGVISGQLFARDKTYRKSVDTKLKEHGLEIAGLENPVDTEDYGIIYGIISNKTDPLNLPFFSKVALRNTYNMLSSYGYRTYFQKIPVDPTVNI